MNTSSSHGRFITLLVPIMLCAAFITGALLPPEALHRVSQLLNPSHHQSRPIRYASSDAVDRSIRRLEWRIKRRERKMFQQMDKITGDIFKTRSESPIIKETLRNYESATAEIFKKIFERMAEIEVRSAHCQAHKRTTPPQR